MIQIPNYPFECQTLLHLDLNSSQAIRDIYVFQSYRWPASSEVVKTLNQLKIFIYWNIFFKLILEIKTHTHRNIF